MKQKNKSLSVNLKFWKDADPVLSQGAKRKRSARWLMIGGGIIALALSCIQVTMAAKVATTGKQIKQYETRKHELYQEINVLHKESADLSKISLIEKKAINELGMRKAVDSQDIIYLSKSTRDSLARN